MTKDNLNATHFSCIDTIVSTTMPLKHGSRGFFCEMEVRAEKEKKVDYEQF